MVQKSAQFLQCALIFAAFVTITRNSLSLHNPNDISKRQEQEETHNSRLFIALNCKNPLAIPSWVGDCAPPLCNYQIYPDFLSGGGYRNFGHRGRFQMQWALDHSQFDWLLRVDEDGYLCIDTLFHVLKKEKAPKEKFFWGRFHCSEVMPRADENFMLMSKDAVRYFVEGWDRSLIPFDGRITLALNVGSQLSLLHHDCGWTFWSDQRRMRWFEKIESHFGCNTHIWFHKLDPQEVMDLHERHKQNPFNSSLMKTVASVNNTGCGREDGLPPFHALKRVAFREGDTKDQILNGNFTHIVADFSEPIPPCSIQ